MAISPSLSTALSGLKAHQTAIQTTSNNISNASNPDYVRERAVFNSLPPINSIPGDIGTGVEISKIYRITDTFLFNRLTATGANLKKYESMEKYLKEIATYFPDVQNKGLAKDIQDFFNSWQTLASNPNDGSAKVALAQYSISLSDSFHQLAGKLTDIQKNINEDIKTKVNEANDILKQIAKLNKDINAHEANGLSKANGLRNKRDALEKRLKELLNVKVYKNDISSTNIQGDETVDYAKDYQISLGGYVLLDNSTYKSLDLIDNKENYNIAVKKDNTSLADITKSIQGEVGGLLAVRGYDFNNDITPKDGTIGDVLSSLNALAEGLIRSINSIYSYSAQPSVQTDPLYKPINISSQMKNTPLPMIEKSLKHPVKDGVMVLSTYDDNGDYTGDIKISIDSQKSIGDILKDINNAIYQNNNNATYGADIVNGEIKFVKGSYDTNGNFTPEISADENEEISPNILVKDDGSTLFSALNELEYIPLKQINTTSLPIPLQNGSFDVVAYDENGNVLAKRTITINMDSTDPKISTIQGIISQINTPDIDDNQDNNPNNDIDDLYTASIIEGKFSLTPKEENIYVGLDKDSANFGGAFGINKFFDGTDAFTINLRDNLANDPSQIHANKTPSQGDNEVANAILQLQSQEITFYKDNETIKDTIFGFYRQTTSSLATKANSISIKKETTQTLFTSIQNEYYSISGVNIDEELINLEKFQRGYQANARVITTINQMLDALFGIKQ